MGMSQVCNIPTVFFARARLAEPKVGKGSPAGGRLPTRVRLMQGVTESVIRSPDSVAKTEEE